MYICRGIYFGVLYLIVKYSSLMQFNYGNKRIF